MDSGDKQVQPHRFRLPKCEAGNLQYLVASRQDAAPGKPPGAPNLTAEGPAPPHSPRPCPARPAPLVTRGLMRTGARAARPLLLGAVILRHAAASADCGARAPLARPPAGAPAM